MVKLLRKSFDVSKNRIMFVLEINDDGYLGYPYLKVQPPLSNRH